MAIKKTMTVVSPEEWMDEEHLILLEGWARDGYAYADIAKLIGISLQQLIKWRSSYEVIQKALSAGREVIDYKVESALLKAALGYKTKEVTIISVLQDGQMVEIEKQEVEREIAPNVNACQTWLYNRVPEKWKSMNNRNALKELTEEDADISITIVRSNRSNKPEDEKKKEDKISKKQNEEIDPEWTDEINEGVVIKKKETTKNKKVSKSKKNKTILKNEKDLNYWPEDWQED